MLIGLTTQSRGMNGASTVSLMVENTKVLKGGMGGVYLYFMNQKLRKRGDSK